MKLSYSCVALGAVVACTSTLMAGTTYDGSGTINTGAYSSLPGGEFTAVPVSGFIGVTGLPADLAPLTFQTFCLEVNETFAPGTTYDMNINTFALLGGSGGPSFPLDPRVAFLYFNFRNLTLAGYDYSPAGRQASASSLQAAIWFIQGNQSGGSNNTFVALADTAISSGAWSGLQTVRVLNLYDGSGNFKQDQLTIVPAPGAAALLGIGSLVATRRRRATA